MNTEVKQIEVSYEGDDPGYEESFSIVDSQKGENLDINFRRVDTFEIRSFERISLSEVHIEFNQLTGKIKSVGSPLKAKLIGQGPSALSVRLREFFSEQYGRPVRLTVRG